MSKLYIKHLEQATNNISLEDRNFLFIRCKHKLNKSDNVHDASVKVVYPITWDQVKDKLSEENLIAKYKPESENDFEYLRNRVDEIEKRVEHFKGRTDKFDRFHPASTCILDIREDEEVALTFIDVSFLEEHERDIINSFVDTLREENYPVRFYDPYFYAYVESIFNHLLWKIRAKEEYNYKKTKARFRFLRDKEQ